ncbi:hypothetical protein H2248_011002 [Termitomyces sp. 'cryptogamus']|nr:hypothetical protein H2248_011002 [Termitomyces sp. 'cryptogamus']
MESSWFPIDIIYEIIQYCDINTLLEIALTSRDCQSQAESLIYRTISFSNKGFFDPDGDLDSKFKASELVGRRTENCVESLAAHPDKACHIRELQLEFEDRTQFYDCDPMFGLIDTVLLAATQLEVLKLQFEYDPDEWVNGIALLSALQRCTFSLKTIVVRDELDPGQMGSVP